MGEGVNVQKRLKAVHNLDAPWRPDQLEQRNGRALRPGNDNAEVLIFTYIKEGTFDSYLWQLLEFKQKFLSQVLSGEIMSRSYVDTDTKVLSYAAIKAAATGDPSIRERMELEVELARLMMLKTEHDKKIIALKDAIHITLPSQIRQSELRIAAIKKDHEQSLTTKSEEFPGMTVQGIFYADKKEAGAALLLAKVECRSFFDVVSVGEYRGFQVAIRKEGENLHRMTLRGESTYTLDMGMDAGGNIQRLENVFKSMPEYICKEQERLADYISQLDQAKQGIHEPFQFAEEVERKSARLEALGRKMDVQHQKAPDIEKVESLHNRVMAHERRSRE
jgi:hypothetical protein